MLLGAMLLGSVYPEHAEKLTRERPRPFGRSD